MLYSARHTFATNLLAETGDLALVARVLGHESITTTERYLHPSTTGVAEIVNRRNRSNGLRLVKGDQPAVKNNQKVNSDTPQHSIAESSSYHKIDTMAVNL